MIKRLSNNSSYYKERKLKRIKLGQHVVPLWLIITLLLSGVFVAALADYLWTSVVIDLDVEEPLELLHYPDELSLYPGEIKEFNVTVMNYASVNYAVALDFSLDNLTYQENYVTFSDETYLVVPDEQNLTAWLQVEAVAPPIETSITIDFHRIADGEGELLFFDNFNDDVADGWTPRRGYTWEVVDQQYHVALGVGSAISTVDGFDFSNGLIRVSLWNRDTEVGFRQGIVFRYSDDQHFYDFHYGDEYDEMKFVKHTPEKSYYGIDLAAVKYPISPNTSYTLEVKIIGDTFTGFLNGEEVLSVTDTEYQDGQVGLTAQRTHVFFDDFTVYSLP